MLWDAESYACAGLEVDGQKVVGKGFSCTMAFLYSIVLVFLW